MSTTQSKREHTKRSNWFDSACGIWFSEPSLEASNFMLLFLAPAIAPCNRNYAKPGERLPGRVKKQDQASEDTIAQQQMELLQFYSAKLDEIGLNNTIPADLTAPADRAKELVYQIGQSKSFYKKDQEFCSKAENGKEDRYLGIFSNARHLDNCDAAGVMEQLSKMYAKIGSIVYQNAPMKRIEFVIRTLEQQILAEVPQIRLPQIQEPLHRMGWLMCAMLLLQAWKTCRSQSNCNLLNVLLGLELEPPVEVTQSVQPQKRNISLEIPMFRKLCAAALRSKMDLQEMRDYFALLQRIDQTAPYCINADMLEPFLQNLSNAFAEQEKPGIDESLNYINTIIELSEMRKSCQEMLRKYQSL